MNSFHRVTAVVVVALVVGLASGVVGAQVPARTVDQAWRAGQTPEEICASAVENLAEPETRTFEQAESVLQDGVDYWALLCTEAGPVYVDLFEAESPITVNSFVFLAQQNYFNNTTFHRVLPGFMAQGGDPTGTGAGDPGYEFADETDNGLVFDEPGLLAMANAGEDTNGSQFFITYGLTPWLDGNHTIFGRVYQGQDNAELLKLRDPSQQPTFEGAALHTIVIVDDPSAVSATPDGVPTIEHWQALLEHQVVGQLNTLFVTVEDFSHTYDLEQEAESWADNGEELVAFMRGYLAQHEFVGTAAVLMRLDECPAIPEDIPIWALGFQVSDYTLATTDVVFSEERAEKLVESGAFETYANSDLGGRIFSLPTPDDEWCGQGGVYYHYEMDDGRYVVAVDVVFDGNIIATASEREQLAGFVMNDLLYSAIGGTLVRGNSAPDAAPVEMEEEE